MSQIQELDKIEPAAMSLPERRMVHLSLSRGRLALLIAALVVPWIATGVLWVTRTNSATTVARRAAAATPATTTNPGPWGPLSYTPLVIAPPFEYIDQLDPTQPGGNPWYFDGMNESQLVDFLGEVDMPQPLRQRILSVATPMDPPAMGMVVKPDGDIIRAMTPKARGQLYHQLSLCPLNRDQNNAFRFCGKSPDEWFEGSSLTQQTLDSVKPLIYRRGSFMFFADFARVAPGLPDEAERNTLAKTLARNATFVMRLNVQEGDDIEGLVRYWGRGGRENDIRPMLESLANGYGGGSVSVARLLPRFARERLFTYTSPTADRENVKRDCHWAALNFFNKEPDNRFTDPVEQLHELETNYRPIFSNLMLGDLVLFTEGPDALIHSAVYVADGVVFTKNGTASTEPGMFIRIEDMKDFYPRAEPLRVLYRRRNDL